MDIKVEFVMEVEIRCGRCKKPLEIGTIAKGWRTYTCPSCINTLIETRTSTCYATEKKKG